MQAGECAELEREIERQGRYIQALEHYGATNVREIEWLTARVKHLEGVLSEIFDMTDSGGIEALINKALEATQND
jgi:hypothetical protein